MTLCLKRQTGKAPVSTQVGWSKGLLGVRQHSLLADERRGALVQEQLFQDYLGANERKVDKKERSRQRMGEKDLFRSIVSPVRKLTVIGPLSAVLP